MCEISHKKTSRTQKIQALVAACHGPRNPCRSAGNKPAGGGSGRRSPLFHWLYARADAFQKLLEDTNPSWVSVGLATVEFEGAQLDPFFNANTQGDLAEAERLLGAQSLDS